MATAAPQPNTLAVPPALKTAVPCDAPFPLTPGGTEWQSSGVYVPRTRQFTIEEYSCLAEQGLFEGEHVELINGDILNMAPDGWLHASTIAYLMEWLFRAMPPNTHIRCQSGLTIRPASIPQPDIAIVPGRPHRKEGLHPESALLVVEVACSFLQFDKDVKAPLYAKAGVAEYWVVDGLSQTMTVHREPVADACPPYYRIIETLTGTDVIRSAILVDWNVSVHSLFAEFNKEAN